jgi:hypothetical protein
LADTAPPEEELRAALAFLVIVVGAALAPTPAAAMVALAVPQITSAPNVIEVDRRCGPGRVWIRGHRNHRGYWVRGHCVRRR